MPFCPKCREEYEAGVSECYDCGVDLVASAADLDELAQEKEFVAFKARKASELAAMEEALKRWEVPCRKLDANASDGEDGCALIVPARYSTKAMQILSNLTDLSRGSDESGEESGDEKPAPDAASCRTGCCGTASAPTGSDLLDRPLFELARMGPAVIDGLIENLLGGNAVAQKRSARALLYLGDEGITTAMKLMKVCLEKEQMETVNVLMAAMRESEHRGEEWKEFLPYLEHAKPVRIKTLEVLGHLADMEAFPSVLPYLGDPDAEVRDEADNTLCLLSDEDMGFEADAPAEERSRVIDRWKTWWGTASGGAL
jgi:hypothetical protein